MSAAAKLQRLSIGAVRMLSVANRTVKQGIMIVTDLTLCFLATVIAFSLRLGEWSLDATAVLIFTAAACSCWLLASAICRIYSNIVRFTGQATFRRIAAALMLAAIPLIVVFLIFRVPGVPRTIALIQPMVFGLLLLTSRLFARFVFVDLLSDGPRPATKNVLIYGAGSAGGQLAVAMRGDRQLRLVGFLDDDARLVGQELDGKPIFLPSALPKLIDFMGVEEVLLALPRISRARRREIVDRLAESPVHVRSLPGFRQLMQRGESISDLQDVRIEDLLGREPVQPDPLLMEHMITGRCVMVTGAGGSIGSELARQIAALKPERLILVEHSEIALYAIEGELAQEARLHPLKLIAELSNVADRDAVRRLLARHRPETIFHAAAYKHVPLVEVNPLAGIRNNVFSTRNLAEEAAICGTSHFVLISTDKAVRPTNIMGASKRICEMILQAKADEAGRTCFSMVRFGNVLGSSGSVVPLFLKQIAAGGPVSLTHRDVTRYFMTIPEAAQLVIQAGSMARGGEVFVLDMGDPVRIHDLAQTMIKLSGHTVRTPDNPQGDIEIVEVGLRRGEKLYEELLIGDSPELTVHPRIMMARERKLPADELNVLLDRLFDAVTAGDGSAATALVRELVPEYVPARH